MLIHTFKPDSSSHQLLLSGFMTALTAVGAFIKIPFFPVPITLQSFFTMLSGSILPPRYAALSQVAYLLLGFIGLPVFANGGGIGYISQPTFGYLICLPVAAYVIARLRRKLFSYKSLLSINFLGALLIVLVGALWLYLSLNYMVGKSISFTKSFLSGAIIFLPGEFLKAFMATVIVKTLQQKI